MGLPLGFFLALCAILLPTSTSQKASIDVYASAIESWRIGSAGTPWLDDVAADPALENQWIHPAPNGHVVADRMAGPVAMAAPFYLSAGSSPDSFSIVPAARAAALATALTGLLLFLCLRSRLGPMLSAVATTGFVLGTPTWSVSADAPWTHTITQLGLAGAAYGASRERWWLVGLFLGVGAWGRPHIVVVAAVLGLGAVRR